MSTAPSFTRKSAVSQITAATPEDVIQHVQRRLALETDCWDVHDSISTGNKDFVLVDVRSPEMFSRGHLPGAVNIPHGKLIASRLQDFPPDSLFVVYCAGPHCNGSSRGALRLAQLGRPVKEMIGGVTGWLDEGFTLETASADQES
ncbi:rhodanese-like domain-containing protein [Permianibacter sp. IMCC34836]|uniref:rhodanese-like domain-containing protein n=1 Tax=Permianibacter fluminis TaxID=2738515 RepID=UPI0015553873|nr:rhodanese-like domain-containing protein [Permianibacter fluminis]NQD37133.1 rhodanese-like domain-containing protein [Permianibacter fluminis]